jgi:predicted dehydrogenase
VVAIAEMSPTARKRAQKAYPGVTVTSDASDVISSTEIDAVAVVTPVWTHYELTKAALQNGKHVFVEKPFTSNAAQGEELINLARQKNLKIMVDHTFLFTGAVKKIRQLLQEGSLGKLYYYDSTRVNLGLFQHDINVLWDLAVHRGNRRDRPETPERLRRCGFHDALLPREGHSAYQRQLALPGKG